MTLEKAVEVLNKCDLGSDDCGKCSLYTSVSFQDAEGNRVACSVCECLVQARRGVKDLREPVHAG